MWAVSEGGNIVALFYLRGWADEWARENAINGEIVFIHDLSKIKDAVGFGV